ncbi:uncharacterized protein LOC128675131 [Plodia interpunctella]|uniref:uncharacterized protein LOC128675131 n=1 Tax=Plodia interpunctella TaxID=58824 RepID=UPI0023687FEB|nr:uncharacterized protein LOC128675131 [Plodia interpunctella]
MSEIYVNTGKLIQAVKKRPGLYKKNDTNSCHRKYKSKMWSEVCREVFSNWDLMRPQEKVEYDHELQKRWKSLRTCFARELALQKKEKITRDNKEGPYKRRKKYEHFDSMTYLLDQDEIEQLEEINDSGHSSDPLDSDLIKTEFKYPSSSRVLTEVDVDDSDPFQQTVHTRNDNVDEKILNVLRDIKRDEGDDDRQFLLSLVPSFKKLSYKQRFEARIEILKVLKAISFQTE